MARQEYRVLRVTANVHGAIRELGEFLFNLEHGPDTPLPQGWKERCYPADEVLRRALHLLQEETRARVIVPQ